VVSSLRVRERNEAVRGDRLLLQMAVFSRVLK
jgi:hypothetical protein